MMSVTNIYNEMALYAKKYNITYDNLYDNAKYLIDNNTIHVFNACKVNFIETTPNGSMFYRSSVFSEWVEYFELDKTISSILRDEVLSFEKTINSRLAYVLEMIMTSNNTSPMIKHDIFKLIRKSKIKMLHSYNYVDTYEFVTKFLFKDTVEVITYMNQKKMQHFLLFDSLIYIFSGYTMNYQSLKNDLSEINNLRNNLCHSVAINYYLNMTIYTNTNISNRRKRKLCHF